MAEGDWVRIYEPRESRLNWFVVSVWGGIVLFLVGLWAFIAWGLWHG